MLLLFLLFLTASSQVIQGQDDDSYLEIVEDDGSKFTLELGQSIKINCTVLGRPLPTNLKWERTDGKKLVES